jgi:hypothetical protein
VPVNGGVWGAGSTEPAFRLLNDALGQDGELSPASREVSEQRNVGCFSDGMHASLQTGAPRMTARPNSRLTAPGRVRAAARTIVSWPPPPAAGSVRPPPASRTLLKAHRGYESAPPKIRDRAPTLELSDDDILETRPTSSLLDPVPVLIAKMNALGAVGTSWQAAGVCAVALRRALRARAVVIHVHDTHTGELRVIAADGEKSHDLLGVCEPSADDCFASAVIANGNPVKVTFDGVLPRVVPQRLRVLGANRAFLAVPVLVDGSCVAIVEVVDPDARFDKRAVAACAYVATRLSTSIFSTHASR